MLGPEASNLGYLICTSWLLKLASLCDDSWSVLVRRPNGVSAPFNAGNRNVTQADLAEDQRMIICRVTAPGCGISPSWMPQPIDFERAWEDTGGHAMRIAVEFFLFTRISVYYKFQRLSASSPTPPTLHDIMKCYKSHWYSGSYNFINNAIYLYKQKFCIVIQKAIFSYIRQAKIFVYIRSYI